MAKSQHIAVLIPAAGASKRIGAPKQLLKWSTSNLLGHSIETAQALEAKEIIVVLGAYFEKIKSEINQYKVQILENRSWELGLGSTIAVGIDHLIQSKESFDAVLIMLPDQPLIVPYYLQSMINKFESGKKQIIASQYAEGKFGVPALFDSHYFLELTLLQDDQGAKKLMEKHLDRVSSLNMNPLISDIDTLDDYNKMYAANHQ
ncbi:MAG: nucleotidyltransferase family protein [Bacteroidia bacterium]|nr:nucleotidyltransferase family protein [Bacteroidia bacterium]